MLGCWPTDFSFFTTGPKYIDPVAQLAHQSSNFDFMSNFAARMSAQAMRTWDFHVLPAFTWAVVRPREGRIPGGIWHSKHPPRIGTKGEVLGLRIKDLAFHELFIVAGQRNVEAFGKGNAVLQHPGSLYREITNHSLHVAVFFHFARRCWSCSTTMGQMLSRKSRFLPHISKPAVVGLSNRGWYMTKAMGAEITSDKLCGPQYRNIIECLQWHGCI